MLIRTVNETLTHNVLRLTEVGDYKHNFSNLNKCIIEAETPI